MSVWEDIKSAWNKIIYVFSKEYQKKVRHYVYLEQNASKIKLEDSGIDFDETIRRLEKKGINPKLKIDFHCVNPNLKNRKYSKQRKCKL